MPCSEPAPHQVTKALPQQPALASVWAPQALTVASFAHSAVSSAWQKNGRGQEGGH